MHQTPEQVMEKVAKLEQDLHRHMVTEVTRLLESGGIDLEEYQDNFLLPKLLYVQALRNIAEQYTPAPWEHANKRTLKRLARF